MTGYHSQPYDPQRHDTDAFNSGEPVLDDWLRRHATGPDAYRTACALVWTRTGSPGEIPAVVLARLPSTAVRKGRVSEAPSSLRRWPGSSRPTSIVAARFVVVDAVHEHAFAFYAHHGFTGIPDTLRLIQRSPTSPPSSPDTRPGLPRHPNQPEPAHLLHPPPAHRLRGA